MDNKLNLNEKLEIKPLLCEVAVICPRYIDFKLWLRENEKRPVIREASPLE